jgi:hypothetical protein
MSQLVLHLKYQLVGLDGSDLSDEQSNIVTSLQDIIQARLEEDYVGIKDKLGALDYEYQDGLIIVTLEKDSQGAVFDESDLEHIINSLETKQEFNSLLILTEADDGVDISMQFMFQDYFVI